MKKKKGQKIAMAVLIIVSILVIGIFTMGCKNDTTDVTVKRSTS
jgi:hypothetical protein